MNSLIIQLNTTIQGKIYKLGRGTQCVHKTSFPLILLSLHFFHWLILYKKLYIRSAPLPLPADERWNFMLQSLLIIFH